MTRQEYRSYFTLKKELADAIARGASMFQIGYLKIELGKLEKKLESELTPGALEPDIPLVLLPVNLETRYVKVRRRVWFFGLSWMTDMWDLLVRIYPDDIHRNNNASQATVLGLPDRWLIRGYTNDTTKIAFEKVGSFIPDPLPYGYFSDPNSFTSPISEQDALHCWMVNFDAAEKVGMGIRIENAPISVELLLVMGIKAAATASEGSDLISEILDSHYKATGLDLVPQGTPTNNTATARSGYNSNESGFGSNFKVKTSSIKHEFSDSADAYLLAQALGLPKHPIFNSIEHANTTDQKDAKAMNSALWPATWGYYLSQLLTSHFLIPGTDWMNEAIGLFPADQVWSVLDGSFFKGWQNYFADYVRARGPLPAIRVGNQPYGILPVSSLKQFSEAGAGFNFVKLLHSLLNIWQEQINQIPNMTQRKESDPDQNLLEILSQEALSSNYTERRVYGSLLLEKLWRFHDIKNEIKPTQPATLFEQHELQKNELLKKMTDLKSLYSKGLPQDRVGYCSFGEVAVPITMPLVLAPNESGKEPLSESALLDPNYIKEISEKPPEEITNMLDDSAPLLKRLLRHATLWAYADAAYRFEPPIMLQTSDNVRENFDIWREPELIDIDLILPSNSQDNKQNVGGKTLTALRYLRQNSRTDPSKTLGALLFELSMPDQNCQDDFIADLQNYRRQLVWLSELPTAALDRLLRETLDLCSYRLDAWITSLTTQRLHELRKKRSTGIHVGGYGWVEKLSIKTTSASDGLIHTPSLTHAATAAILRSGYLSHNQSEDGDILALDLSSRRVRQALELLDGVRQGQPLGALLGYRFERTLHEMGLAQYTTRFRQLAPLVAGKETPNAPNTPVENLAADNVVDGLKLVKLFEEKKLPWGESTAPERFVALPAETHIDGKDLEEALKILRDVADSVSDVLTAESVYQTVQGNPIRSGATLDALSRGEAIPQEIEVARTPRSGVSLTHRLLMLFSADTMPELAEGWDNDRARAKAEPLLNQWLGMILGDPAQICYQIRYYDQSGATLGYDGPPFDLTKKFCPLDLLYAMPLADPRGSEFVGEAQLSELEQRLIYEAQNPEIAPQNTHHIKLDFARKEGWEPTVLSLPEALEIARAARDFISRVRPLQMSDLDLALPAGIKKTGLDLEELKSRTADSVATFKECVENLETSITSSDSEKLRENLLKLSQYDIPGTIPVSSRGDYQKEVTLLLEQAQRVLREAQRRQSEINQIEVNDTPNIHIEKLKKLFGEHFQVIPLFKVNLNLMKKLKTLRDNGKVVQPMDIYSWLERIGHVREAVDRFNLLSSYSEVLRAETAFEFHVAQLAPGDRTDEQWIAQKLESEQRYKNGQLALVIAMPGTEELPSSDKSMAGLFVDEWIEVVPEPEETTGVAFHYDAPGASAPQTILMAVPPVQEQKWDWNSLSAVLQETFVLAKIRGIDPDIVAKLPLGQYLPALFLAYNVGSQEPAGDTISTTFRK